MKLVILMAAVGALAATVRDITAVGLDGLNGGVVLLCVGLIIMTGPPSEWRDE